MNHLREYQAAISYMGGVYMVLNAAQVRSSEYRDLQISQTTQTEVTKIQIKDAKKHRVCV